MGFVEFLFETKKGKKVMGLLYGMGAAVVIIGALFKIQQLQGIEFDWIPNEKHHGYEGHDVGVIAQEVEKVIPEIVQTRDSGYKAVKYEKMIPLLIEGIKEQQKQIETLTARIDKLEGEG